MSPGPRCLAVVAARCLVKKGVQGAITNVATVSRWDASDLLITVYIIILT